MKKIVVCFWALLGTFVSHAQDNFTHIKTGDTVPSFSFELTEGKTVHISDYKGRLVLLNMFATWCPPCNAELPEVQKLIWAPHKNDPRFAFFVFGREEGWEKLKPFKEKKGFDFPILPDEGRKIFSLFASQNIPRNFLIDENGKIIYSSTGYSAEELQELVDLINTRLK
ncbi:TlpA family protein disulfide reductase [Chitinophaga sp. 22321]|uniref:TlpA family protein disulfide reductase n=1 Tax=Chitinophaga hostae TaxID=2831022 RepID=A0ABS5J675_9BACT|nr:TlpA disulfide reductase family protein [Chitinophaga hostae]MBS0030077.1 TlpA family protein disulfide reductase [Chitinophaga hostae]